uniref:Transcriptional regulator n=1 Tax=Meloidogyne hapla TaxID=6305 RepID=A0A1I8BRL1_MELHA
MNRYYKMTSNKRAFLSSQVSNNIQQTLKLSKDDEAAIEELFGEICNRQLNKI